MAASPAEVPEGYRGPGYDHYHGHGYGHGHSHHDSSYHGAKHEPENTNYELQDKSDTADNPAYDPDSSRRHPFLSRLALPIGTIVTIGIMAGATYAVVARVQHLIANASVSGDLASWKLRARNEVYDACYNGCTSCNDPDFAYNACQTTAKAIVKGVNCDGARMWNWAVQDRYPDQCLTALAGIMMGDALAHLKQSYRNQLALIILTVLGGILGGFLVYKGIRMATMTKHERWAARSNRAWSVFKPRTWYMSMGRYSNVRRRTAAPASPSRRGGKMSTKKLAAAFAGVFGARGAASYPCAGRDAAWSQFFASPSGAVTGVVHSWFSECRDRQNCYDSCRDSCSTNASGIRTCTKKCTKTCTTVTSSERIPKDYVDIVTPKVRACGFNIVDALNGAAITTRVANPGIERNHRVRISVNGLNVTRPDQTDAMVVCLYEIGN